MPDPSRATTTTTRPTHARSGSAGTGRGDLGYLDDDRYLYFAGRNADWIRVDGENFPAQPIENDVARHPDVVLAAVYGVPDDQAGDQVMAGLVLRDGATFDPDAFATWLDAQSDDRAEVASAVRAGDAPTRPRPARTRS